jgi:hypothetical protein
MALQPRFDLGLFEKIPPLYSISSEVRPVTLLSLFTWFRLPAKSIALHDADDIRAVELPIEFEIVPAPVHTINYFALALHSFISYVYVFENKSRLLNYSDVSLNNHLSFILNEDTIQKLDQ